MKKILFIIFVLFLTVNLYSAPPIRTYTYTTGEKIEASKVTTNEDNIYNYLTAGIDTVKDDSIANADISSSAAIVGSKLDLSAPGAIGGTTPSTGAFTILSGTALSATSLSVGSINLTGNITTAGTVDGKDVSTLGDMDYTNSRVYVGTFTHDVSVEGSQQITGVGFQPTSIILFASLTTTIVSLIGITDGTNKYCFYQDAVGVGNFSLDSAHLLLLETTNDSAYASANLTSFDSGGFTVGWAKASTPTGTAGVSYIAFR
jgi:hypothetical protein